MNVFRQHQERSVGILIFLVLLIFVECNFATKFGKLKGSAEGVGLEPRLGPINYYRIHGITVSRYFPALVAAACFPLFVIPVFVILIATFLTPVI